MTGPPPPLAAVRAAVRRATDDLPRGSVVLVACSGGADSLALATATAFVAPRAGLRAAGVTVDHGLQEGSAARAAALVAVLAGLGLDPVEAVAVAPGKDGGPEAAARRARYRALDAVAQRLGAAAVLLGHTRDDQAETVLLGLARGSGTRSLAGMAPVVERYRRPLLGLSRSVVREAAVGLPVWEDPTNGDPRFARSRVRQEGLPALEEALGPGVAAALARSAEQLRADADALDHLAARARDRGASVGDWRDAGRGLSLAVAWLDAEPAALRRRLLRAAALAAGASAGALGATHVAAMERLVTDWHGQGRVDLPGGVGAWRACDRVEVGTRD